jgi:hypothetical protein
MIILTSTCEFLIESSNQTAGCVFIYSASIEELQPLFGSSEVEYSSKDNWRYMISTCKQKFSNALILLVKEIIYTDFAFPTFHRL